MAFIDGHRNHFGVEPMCRVLCEHGVRIVPSTYYAARGRTPSARSIADAALLVEIRRVHGDRTKPLLNPGRCRSGACAVRC